MAGGQENMRTWRKHECSENTSEENRSIVRLVLSGTVWNEQKSGSKRSLMERHIRVETLPSMQHVKASHSCDLTPHNKNHLHEGKKDKRQTEGVGCQAGEDGKHQNKSINQRHRWSPALVINPRKTIQHFSVDYTNKRPGAKKHIVVPHPVFELAAIWNVLLPRRWQERRLTTIWCYVVDFQVPSPELTSPHRRFLPPVLPILLLHWHLHSQVCSLLCSWPKDATTQATVGLTRYVWRCECEEMGLTGMNWAREIRLRAQTNKLWEKKM